MRIGVASGNSHFDKLLAGRIDEEVDIFPSLDGLIQNSSEDEILIVSTRLPGKVLDFAYGQKDKIIILLTDRPEDLTLIPPNITVYNTLSMMEEDILVGILDVLNSEDMTKAKMNMYLKMGKRSGRSKVCVMYSPIAGQGKSTFIKHLSTYMASREKSKKIAVVDFNLFQSDLLYSFGIKEDVNSEKCLENLKSGATKELLEKNIYTYKNLANLHILPPVSSPYSASDFEGKHIAKILDNLKQKYDYIFVEVHSHLSTHAAIMPLMMADSLFILTSLKHKSLRSFNKWFSADLRQNLIAEKEILGIITNNFDDSSEISKSDLESSMKMDCIAHLPKLPKIMEYGVIIDSLDTDEVSKYKNALNQVISKLTN